MKPLRSSLVLFLVSLTFALTIRPAPQILGTPTTPIENEWMKDWNSSNIDALVKLYSTDAVYLTDDGRRLVGRTDIATYLKQRRSVSVGDLKFTGSTGEVSSHLAYESGTWENIGSSNGSLYKLYGNYLLVVSESPQHTWQIVQHASNYTVAN